MKIELINIQHNAGNSHETHCFHAEVTLDGVPAFQVSNEGHGGEHCYLPLTMQSKDDFCSKLKAAEAFAATLHSIEDPDPSLEVLIGELVNEWIYKRELARMLKSQVVIFEQGQFYSFNVHSKPTAPGSEPLANIARAHPNATILNDLPRQEAETFFIEQMRRKFRAGS